MVVLYLLVVTLLMATITIAMLSPYISLHTVRRTQTLNPSFHHIVCKTMPGTEGFKAL